MHIIFMPYGKIECVERTLNDIRAQKYTLTMTSPDGKETKHPWIDGQLRVLPFGFYEVVCPREHLDCVLNTLGDKADRYKISKTRLALIRKALHAEKIPEIEKKERLLWNMEHVHSILIGIREDRDIIDPSPGEWNGWKHEAI